MLGAYYIKIKKNILIASIVRNSKVIIPGGLDEIKAEDSVIIITLNLLVLYLRFYYFL